jgi:hypothetical protein
MTANGLEDAFRSTYVAEAKSALDEFHTRRDRPYSGGWNNIGISLMQSNAAAAEALYDWALGKAREIESAARITLKKGIEYCNLGAAQFIQDKFDPAYQNFELAEAEDLEWGTPSYAGIKVIEGVVLLPAGQALARLVSDFVRAEALPAAEAEDTEVFWNDIERRDRLCIREVLPRYQSVSGATDSGRNLRLRTWHTLATLTERMLRKKHTSIARDGEQQLLRAEFGSAPANDVFHAFVPAHQKVVPADLDGHLAAALSWRVGPLSRAMAVFYVVRNYCAHHGDSAVGSLKDDHLFQSVLRHLAYFATKVRPPAHERAQPRVSLLGAPDISAVVSPSTNSGPIVTKAGAVTIVHSMTSEYGLIAMDVAVSGSREPNSQ